MYEGEVVLSEYDLHVLLPLLEEWLVTFYFNMRDSRSSSNPHLH